MIEISGVFCFWMFPPVLESRPDPYLVWNFRLVWKLLYYISRQNVPSQINRWSPSEKKIKKFLYYRNKVISLYSLYQYM